MKKKETQEEFTSRLYELNSKAFEKESKLSVEDTLLICKVYKITPKYLKDIVFDYSIVKLVTDTDYETNYDIFFYDSLDSVVHRLCLHYNSVYAKDYINYVDIFISKKYQKNKNNSAKLK